jgi:hypothetical protein
MEADLKYVVGYHQKESFKKHFSTCLLHYNTKFADCEPRLSIYSQEKDNTG